jgi:lipopolysaccharide transport system ATP-binding protein
VRLPIKTYSQGMLARLMFACATEYEADVLVLDEWLAAGDADFVAKAAHRMQTFVDKAKIVVMGTHNFALAQQVCNKVCVLDSGRITYLGPTEGWIAGGGGLKMTEA